MNSSSALRKVAHIPDSATFRALNTGPYPAPFKIKDFFRGPEANFSWELRLELFFKVPEPMLIAKLKKQNNYF